MDQPKQFKLSRRDFLKVTGTVAAGLAFHTLPRWAWAAASAAPASSSKVLVVLFQRGAADGLNIVVPFNSPLYRKSRPTIALGLPGQDKGILDLDGQFGLHPSLAPLLPLWKSGQFAAVQAVGSPDGTRSHFDAQDNMETGTPGVKTTPDGWLNRSLLAFPKRPKSSLAAMAVTPRLPRILRGDFPVTTFTNMQAYKFFGGMGEETTFDQMYEESVDKLLSGAGKETRDSVDALQKILGTGPQKAEDAGYPKSKESQSFFQLARIIKAKAGLRVGFVDIGGWDDHVQEENRLQKGLEDLGGAIAAFYQDLGDKANDVLLVSMTEFGRTLQENGNRGTDHGHASVMMLFGGGVKGGKVYGSWPGLEQENLFEGRDLQVTTDFRQVLTEALTNHLGISDVSGIFPSFQPGSSVGFYSSV
jgi:uncharacterized protein (DUF1501 family)